MSYAATKVYYDGSHYISIPQQLSLKKKGMKERVSKKNNNDSVVESDLKTEIFKSGKDYTVFDYVKEIEEKEKRVNKKKKYFPVADYFEKCYKESLKLHKKDRFKYVLGLMENKFNDKEYAKNYVSGQLKRKNRNLICRRMRLSRKAFLNQFNYFSTFTYDSKKIDEESFKKKLKRLLSNYAFRKGWKYIGVWERGAKSNRLHFHCIVYVPEGTMPGEIIERKDYSFSTHNMQITHQNTYFNKKFGRTDFEKLESNELGDAVAYLLKYIEKSGEKIVYSRKLPQYVISDIMDYDVICDTGMFSQKKVLFNDFDCFCEGELIGKVNQETLSKMPSIS